MSVEPSVRDGDDERVLRAFRAGRPSAFDDLARAHRARIVRVCYRYTGSHYDADDLAQEVLLRAYRGLSSFRADARLSTWLYRITVNVCLNWAASRRHPTEALSSEPVSEAPSPLERLFRREREEKLRRAVAELPERQRATLILRVYEDLKYKEIAAVMDCPVGTTKANFFFALKNLRKKLRSEEGHR